MGIDRPPEYTFTESRKWQQQYAKKNRERGEGDEFELLHIVLTRCLCKILLQVHNVCLLLLCFALYVFSCRFSLLDFLLFFFKSPDTHHIPKAYPFETREEWAEKLALRFFVGVSTPDGWSTG